MQARSRVQEDIPLTIAVTLGVWGAAVFGGATSGAFARLPFGVVTALAAFLTAFALGAAFLDAEVRAFLRAGAARVARVALLLDATLVAYALFGPWDERLAAFPHAVALLFVLPLAAVASVATLSPSPSPKGEGSRLFRSPATKSPGARPAAT